MSGSCCSCYIVYLYCLWFDRGVVHVVFVTLSTINVGGLTEEWIILLLVYFLPLLFDTGVVNVMNVILATFTVCDLLE